MVEIELKDKVLGIIVEVLGIIVGLIISLAIIANGKANNLGIKTISLNVFFILIALILMGVGIHLVSLGFNKLRLRDENTKKL